MLLLQKNNRLHTVITNIQWLCLCLFAATLWCRRDINQACLIASLFFSLFLFDSTLLKKNFKTTLALSATYLVSIISTTYSSNIHEAMFVLEKQMTLILVPVIFSFSLDLDYKKLKVILICFIISLLVACIYLLAIFYTNYVNAQKSEPFQVFLEHNMHHDFSKALKMHATYMSMYVCFAIAYCLYSLFKSPGYYKIIAFLCLIIFGMAFVLLSSRIIFMSSALIMFLVLPFFISGKQLGIYAILILLFGSASFYLYNKSAALKERLKNDTYRELNIQNNPGNTNVKINDDATRAERWKCAMELIKESPLIGYGTGDEKNMLSLKYAKYNLIASFRLNFDAHNQYFSFMIKSGLFGLISYLVVLGWSAYIAFKKLNYIHIAFLVIIITASFTENILESNKGVLFFVFFNTLMVHWPTSRFKRIG